MLVVSSLLIFSWTGYSLYFPQQQVTDYANVWGMKRLGNFTVCFWMDSNATNRGTPFSYATSESANELLIYNYDDFELTIVYDSVWVKFNLGVLRIVETVYLI